MFGIFENPDKFLDTVSKVHQKGAQIIDCYTPFPMHGIDKAMGLKRSLLPIELAFLLKIVWSTGFALPRRVVPIGMYPETVCEPATIGTELVIGYSLSLPAVDFFGAS